MHDIGKLISYVKTCKPAHKRWKNTKVLIIDEVSMVDGQLFDTLAKLAVELRKKTDRPFGGIQVRYERKHYFKTCKSIDHAVACRHWRFLSASPGYKGWQGTILRLPERRMEDVYRAYSDPYPGFPTEG